MNIEKYIRNKSNVRVLKLIDDDNLLKELGLCTYKSIDWLENCEKNMKMSLSLDDYSEILLDNKKHQLNNIFKAKNLNILDCTGGFARDAAK